MSKFADNLEDLAERTAEYIRMLEKDVERLNKIKVNLSQRSLENTKEIAELQAEVQQYKSALIAYASEFSNDDEEGLPDVGNIHKNIRTLKSQQNDLLIALDDIAKYYPNSWAADRANTIIAKVKG